MLDTTYFPNRLVPTDKAVAQQRRLLRRLFRDLVTFAGVAASDLAAPPRPQCKRSRLLYRKGDTLTPDEVTRIVVEIGPERVLRAVDKLTQPTLPLQAAERREAVS